jgi:excisionase family DNA binding protein
MQDIMNPYMVGALLGLTREGVVYLINSGKLRGSRVGKLWVILKADLLAYMAQRRVDSVAGTGERDRRYRGVELWETLPGFANPPGVPG